MDTTKGTGSGTGWIR